MKKTLVAMLVMGLLVALMSGAAFAKKGENKGKGHKPDKVVTYVFKGTVTEVGDGSVVVDVEKGNSKGRAFAGEQVSFAVTDSTKVEKDGDKATLDEVSAGDEVNVQSKAKANATDFTARHLHAESPEAESDDS